MYTHSVTIAVTGVYKFTITVELQKFSTLCYFANFSYLFVKKQNNLAICIGASSYITPMPSTWQGMSIFEWSIASLLMIPYQILSLPSSVIALKILETICPFVL